MSGPLLNRTQIEHAFTLLAAGLSRRGVHADLYVIGGAAIALAWDERRTTRDIDAVFSTDRHQVLLEEVWAVAAQLDLPRSWLNEQASAYVPTLPDPNQRSVWDAPSLRVLAASAEFVLAMKARAGRPTDNADIVFLVHQLKLTSLDEVVAIHDAVFPLDPLPARKLAAIEEVFLK
jgi:Nucleotidyltransferase of unknown function (DUF6036)